MQDAVSYQIIGDNVGVRGVAGDLAMDELGNLTSKVTDFTLLPIVPGQIIFVGSERGASEFMNVASNGVKTIYSVEPHMLHLVPHARQRGVQLADDGAGREIEIYFGVRPRTP